MHVVDFYNRINLIYGTICDRCTEQTCPTMSGGKKFEYHWRDNVHYKKPTPLPAPKYIDELMDWVDAQINDPSLFPTDMGIIFYFTWIRRCSLSEMLYSNCKENIWPIVSGIRSRLYSSF